MENMAPWPSVVAEGRREDGNSDNAPPTCAVKESRALDKEGSI